MIDGSKLVLMNGSGEVIKFGSFIKKDGIYYSNSSFRKYEYIYEGNARDDFGDFTLDYMHKNKKIKNSFF